MIMLTIINYDIWMNGWIYYSDYGDIDDKYDKL